MDIVYLISLIINFTISLIIIVIWEYFHFLLQIFAKIEAVITHNVAKIADGIAVLFEKCFNESTAPRPAFCIPNFY